MDGKKWSAGIPVASRFGAAASEEVITPREAHRGASLEGRPLTARPLNVVSCLQQCLVPPFVLFSACCESQLCGYVCSLACPVCSWLVGGSHSLLPTSLF